jgi:uncharacterized damage-inducible protein DinB
MGAKQKLLETFGKMEAERESIISEMAQYSEELLTKKPDANSWSVAEVIMHLVVAEGGALAYMKKKLEFGGHSKSTFGAAVKQKLLNLAVALPVKYKAPKVASIEEGQNISFAEASTKWETLRQDLLSEYQVMDDEIVLHELFKHPAAGKMNVLQSVEFMRNHMNRHIKQMRSTVKAIS